MTVWGPETSSTRQKCAAQKSKCQPGRRKSLRREGSGLRQRAPRNRVDINENQQPDITSSSPDTAGGEAGTSLNLVMLDDVDSRGQSRPRQNRAMEIMSHLPSRQLSVDGGSSDDYFSSSSRGRSLRRSASAYPRSRGDIETQLSTADSLPTEDEQWHRRRTIRDMPTSIENKRVARRQLMSQQSAYLSGIDSWKFHQRVTWSRHKEKCKDFLLHFKLWEGSFKTIDGQFGMGIGSYFRFLKWLLFLNIYILLIILCVLTIPQIVLHPHTFKESIEAINLTTAPPKPVAIGPGTGLAASADAQISGQQMDYVQQAIDCSSDYAEAIQNITNRASIPDQVLNFLQGMGFMERTILFYGHYFNKTYYSIEGEAQTGYIMPLAYILATCAYFLVSLVLMVRNSAKGFKENFVDSQSRYFQYCNKIFTAWDFCMTSDTACRQKHRNLFREFRLDMENERIRTDRMNRSCLAKFGIYTIRLFINIMVITVLVAAGVAIFYVNEKSLEWSTVYTNELLLLMVQYAPSLCITFLNAIVPLIFIYIVQPEDYSPEFEIRITLIRTVFLRLSSLAVLIASLHVQITQCSDADHSCGNCGQIQCWETYVGQQFYRLTVMDFVISVAVVLFYEFPRRICVEKSKNKVIQMIGLPEFDIPRSVLDIVYGQTLCWIGAFFCPLIPLICVLKLVTVFYLKKASLLRNFISSARTYRASKSNAFFTIVLLVSFVLTTIPVGYSIGKIPPSQSCGPFRIYSSDKHYMFSTMSNLIASWPSDIRNILYWVMSTSCIVPLIILLCIAMYYYYIVASGQKRMVLLLKDQLALEARDKRFLIERVNDAMVSRYGTGGK